MDKTETSMMEIAQSKIFADEAKYFSLFEKHIPVLGTGSQVLIYAIDNLGCICRMIEKNPDAQYTVYGNACVNDCVKMMYPSVKTIDSNPGNLKEYNIDMKFDCILMNPPYERGLHMKILAQAFEFLKDKKKSRIVNLAPINKFQYADLFGLENPIPGIYVNEIISHKDANNCFCTGLMMDLGISMNINNHIEIVPNKNLLRKYLSITDSMPKLYDRCSKNNTGVHLIKFHSGKALDNHGISPSTFRIMAMNTDDAFNSKFVGHAKWFEAANQTEQLNIFKTYHCTVLRFFYKEICGSYEKHIPWMGDCINPRTGKKGYESEWTDEDFYQFFKITDEEKKIIEDTMAKYVK